LLLLVLHYLTFFDAVSTALGSIAYVPRLSVKVSVEIVATHVNEPVEGTCFEFPLNTPLAAVTPEMVLAKLAEFGLDQAIEMLAPLTAVPFVK
jgi:hypothetical protein